MEGKKNRINTGRDKIVCLECKTGRSFNKDTLSSRLTLPDDFIHTSVDQNDNTRAYQSLIANCRRSDVMWLACSGGKLHTRAVQGGRTRSGEPIYIARARSPEWNMCLGCFLPSRGVCYIPWRGSALVRKDYELLCRKEAKRVRNVTDRPVSANRPSVVFDDSFQVLSFKNPLRPSVHPRRVPYSAGTTEGGY